MSDGSEDVQSSNHSETKETDPNRDLLILMVIYCPFPKRNYVLKLAKFKTSILGSCWGNGATFWLSF